MDIVVDISVQSEDILKVHARSSETTFYVDKKKELRYVAIIPSKIYIRINYQKINRKH